MENKDRQKLLIIVVVVVLGLLVANSAVYEPLKSAWDGRQKKIKGLQDGIAEDHHLINKRDLILDKWDHMQKNALTNDVSAAQQTLLKALDTWAQRAGVATDNITPEDRKDNDENSDAVIHTIECHADAAGTMASLEQFLYNIENDRQDKFPMGVKIENVEITAKDATGQQLTMNLTLSGLILGDEDNSTPAARPAKDTETP